LRSHLERITTRMRTHVEQHPDDGAAYRMFALAAAARAEHLQDRTLPLAHTAAELAHLLGAPGETDLAKLADADAPSLAILAGGSAEEVLFADAREPQLRALFRLFAEPIARLVGVEAVARKDRVRPSDQVATIAREIAATLGFRAVDIYVSSRTPLAMFADTTSPTTLVLGNSLVTDPTRIRFATTAALALARLELGVPARLPVDELAAIALAVVSLVDPNAHISAGEAVRLEALRR
jgi:hypothetical protein